MIELADVRKRYGRRNVLNGVSFTAEKGRITCLIGMNGAGKSTILKAIMGLAPIDGGSIRIDGKPIGKRMYENIAFVPDRLPMPSEMRLAEAMRFMADFYPNWDGTRAGELIELLRLERTERIGNLSKGMAAKFNLLLGLAIRSDYVLMDEPLSGIDLFSREMIADVFSSGLLEERGVLLTTHEIGEMERLLDQAVLIEDGVVVRQFDCEHMRNEEGKSVVDVMREVYRA